MSPRLQQESRKVVPLRVRSELDEGRSLKLALHSTAHKQKDTETKNSRADN